MPGGIQNAQNGKCPDGFVHVFGPLCVEKTKLDEIKEAIPDLPDFEMKDSICETALAALQQVNDMVKQAIQMPLKLLDAARRLVELPFDVTMRFASQMLGIIDQINGFIDDLLSGPAAVLDDFKNALGKLISCPFMESTAMGKAAAQLLDVLEDGLPYTEILYAFKSLLLNTLSDNLNQLKETPVAALERLENLYQDMLERSKVFELLELMDRLRTCVEGVCDMIAIADRLPSSSESIRKTLGAVRDDVTNKFKVRFDLAVNQGEQAIFDAANKLRIIRFTV